MIISIEINNDHYLNGITEFSRIAQMKPDDLCRELLCGVIDQFYKDRAGWEQEYVYAHLPIRALRSRGIAKNE